VGVGAVADRTHAARHRQPERGDEVCVDVMLAEPRRYWLDRDLPSGLGAFHAPALL
jgi:hypothetical protein